MTNDHRPWKAFRTLSLFASRTTAAPPKGSPESGVMLAATQLPPEEHYDVDLSKLDEVARRPAWEWSLGDGEKSTWSSRATLAMDMAQLRESFSKSDVDTVIAQAERHGMAFTKSRAYIVVFNGQSFTLARNTLTTRVFFRLDSLLRKWVSR